MVQLLLFASAGAGWCWYLRKKTPALPLVKKWLYILAPGIIIFSVLALLQFLLPAAHTRMAAASAAAFLFPCMALEAWRAYKAIPLAEYKPWYNPAIHNNQLSMMQGKNHPVRFQVYMHCEDKMERSFDIMLPRKLKLGLAFHYFLHEHNSMNVPATSIEVNNGTSAFGWEFYEEIMGGLYSRWLSPELSLVENKVREYAIICIRRRMPLVAHA